MGCFVSCQYFPGDKTVAQHIVELEGRIKVVRDLLGEIRSAIGLGSDMALKGEYNITLAEGIIQQAQEALRVSHRDTGVVVWWFAQVIGKLNIRVLTFLVYK